MSFLQVFIFSNTSTKAGQDGFRIVEGFIEEDIPCLQIEEVIMCSFHEAKPGKAHQLNQAFAAFAKAKHGGEYSTRGCSEVLS